MCLGLTEQGASRSQGAAELASLFSLRPQSAEAQQRAKAKARRGMLKKV